MTQQILALPDSDIAPVTEGGVIKNPSTARMGKISEAAFYYEAVRRGWDVLLPPVDAADYDCIIKRCDTRPIAIQVKRAKRHHSLRSYNIRCCRGGGKNLNLPYSHTAFDALAVHLSDVNRWIFFTRSEIGNRVGTSYIVPEERKKTPKHHALPDRLPDNWSLLHQLAATNSQESFGGTPTNVPDPQ